MEIVCFTLHRRRCPKCGGNVCLDQDIYGPYWRCLQCGTTWDVEERTLAKVPTGISK